MSQRARHSRRLLAVVAALAILVLAFARPIAERGLGAAAGRILGDNVRIERVQVSLLSPRGLALANAAVTDPVDGSSVLTVEKLRLGIDLSDLLRGRLAIRGVALRGAVFELDLGGPRALTSFGVVGDLFKGGSEPKPAEGEASSPSKLDIPIQSEDFSMLVDPPGNGRAIALRFRESKARVHRAADERGVRVAIDSSMSGDGHLTVNVESSPLDHGSRFEVAVDASKAPAGEIFENPPGDFRLYGLRAKIQWRSGSPDSLRGSGTFVLESGTMGSGTFGQLLWQALLGIVPGAGRREKKLIEVEPNELRRLQTEFTLKGRRVDLTGIDLDSDDYLIDGSGHIDLDLNVQLQLEVALTPSGLTKLLTSYDLPVNIIEKVPPIPVEVSGTLREPRVRAKMTSLPLSTAGYLADSAGGVGEKLRGLGHTLLEGGRSLVGQPREGEEREPSMAGRLPIGVGDGAPASLPNGTGGPASKRKESPQMNTDP